ncbi:MAG TPA: response regulator [Oculatellaceae cyanobacterium]|jgi:two-component system chemotaxis response regulator CheY
MATKKILSVDDSIIIRKIFKGIAETLGLGFLEAGDGQQALNVLADHHQEIALIILDWNMPVKNGYDTLQEITTDPRYKHIPVMMATTETERTNVIKAIQAGAKHYVTKPFTQEDVLVRITECLKA